MQKVLQISIVSLIIVLLCSHCAQIGSPVGGAKDTIPPQFVKSEPSPYSTEFTKNKIEIDFNEFFVLKDIQQKLIMSPPVNEKPIIKIKGKRIVIELPDSLKENTTYTLDFADCIQDLNENNPIPRFEYVFSTGTHIDSLAVAGTLFDAFTLEAVESVFVMLYELPENNSTCCDSIPYKKLPAYIAKTNAKGEFLINNICTGSFRVFALEDANSNLLFDQPAERIAFIDSVYIPKAEIVTLPDTVKIEKDSLLVDSIIQKKQSLFSPADLQFRLFQEDYQKQFLSTSTRVEKGKCQFIFKRKIENLVVKAKNFEANEKTHLKISNDTATFWLASEAALLDTLIFDLEFETLDSLNNSTIDTLEVKLSYIPDEKPKSKRGRKNEVEEPDLIQRISLTSNTSTKTLDYQSNVILNSNTPLKFFDTEKISLVEFVDTNQIIRNFEIENFSQWSQSVTIKTKWQAGSYYQLNIDSLAFIDVFGNTNDSTGFFFMVREPEYYGKLAVTIEDINNSFSHILQIINKDGSVFRQISSEGNNFVFELVPPANYKLRLIEDKNKNFIWDTGNYLKNIQPEKVYNYSLEIVIKSNWDSDITWKLYE